MLEDQKILTDLLQKAVDEFPDKIVYNQKPEATQKRLQKWAYLTGQDLIPKIVNSPQKFKKLFRWTPSTTMADLSNFYTKTPSNKNIPPCISMGIHGQEIDQKPISRIMNIIGSIVRPGTIALSLRMIHREAVFETYLSVQQNPTHIAHGNFQELYRIMKNCGISHLFLTKGQNKNILYALPFPKAQTNAQGRLHCETGPAMEWPSGTKRYAINGVVVPK